MAKLNNKQLGGGFTANLAQSFGPFLSLDGERFLFDTRIREFPLWLGYNASPLFGVAQHLETWTGQFTREFERVEKAYEELTRRVKDKHCGKLKFESSRTLNPAGVLYNYISLSILDQFADEHLAIAEKIENGFENLMIEHGALVKDAYVDGKNFEFGFEFLEKELSLKFAAARTSAGIFTVPWPRMSHALKFHLNLAYREREMELFWQRLNLLFQTFRDDAAEYPDVELDMFVDSGPMYEFHNALISAKVNRKLARKHRVEPFLESRLTKFAGHLSFVVLDRDAYRRYRSKILAMQSLVYEPVRQSPPEEFDMLFDSEKPLGILVLSGDEIVAMTFAGQLGLFKQERGVIEDPFVDEPHAYYNMDLTVAPDFRGGLGRIMKQAMILLAIGNGVTALHGRNRDRLARGMWAINLAQGSFELQHLFEDYPDDEPYRDCIYYRCPLEWNDVDSVCSNEISRSIATMINGIGLRNVIIEDESHID